MPAGRATLHTAFRGVLNDKLRGFYRSTFTDADGAEQVIATTQFEATDARRAFPCWDEPDYKAIFAVTLVVDADLLAVSNAAEVVATPSAAHAGPRRGALRRHDVDVDLPGGLHRRPARGHRPRRRRRHPAAGRVPAGQGPPHRLRPRGRRVLPALLRRLLRHRLPGRQARPRRHPRLRLRRHGEPRLRHVPRDRSCWSTPTTTTQAELQQRRRRHRPRARPHVVRRPRHDEVVERHLAQRGLRHVHGDARPPTPSGPSGSGGSPSGWPAPPPSTPTPSAATRPDRVPGGLAGRRRGHVRRPHLREGRRGGADARAVPRRGRVPRRHPARTWPANAYGNTETTDLWDAIEEATGEPVRRIMDSWIFQGGFPIVDVDLVERRPHRCASPRSASPTPATSARASRSTTTPPPPTPRSGRCR